MPRKIRQLIRILEKAGFIHRGGKGSQRNFTTQKVMRRSPSVANWVRTRSITRERSQRCNPTCKRSLIATSILSIGPTRIGVTSAGARNCFWAACMATMLMRCLGNCGKWLRERNSPPGARLPAGATPHCLTAKGLRLKIEEGLKGRHAHAGLKMRSFLWQCC
jgi:hypothetical protein